MIRNLSAIALLLIPFAIHAQGTDDTLKIREVIVTATFTERTPEDLPCRTAIINSKEIGEQIAGNTDDLLRSIANVYVNRSWGIFSKNSSVTMRGMDGSARVLVMLDNMPLNKTAGGSINWHMIIPESIERIEVIKGPSSALYGSNAMGGVINILTKNPTKKLYADACLYGGAYNTYGGNLSAGGSNVKDNRGFFWNLNGFYRYGEGYIFDPEDNPDSTSSETSIEEKGAGAKLGYRFNAYNSLEISHFYYEDRRGSGRKVYEDDGAWLGYPTHSSRLNYKGKIGDIAVDIIAFLYLEDYYELKESLNDYGEYKLSETFMNSDDAGLWASFTRSFDKHRVTSGFDAKHGVLDGEDLYRTSYDHVVYKGKLHQFALFIQDEITLSEKLNMVLGMRFDDASYTDGYLQVTDPTKNTGFTGDYEESFDANSWASFSPKLAVKYMFSEKFSSYISAGTGFNPPKLKDLASSGKISKGFKLSNPYLTPEIISSTEAGCTWSPGKKIKFEPAIYYSYGKDFQYLVSTGDSVDTGSDEMKAVFRKENVSNVEITGAEISFRYERSKHLSFYGSYAYNHSLISRFNSDTDPDKDLTGKFLMEVSPHLAFAGMTARTKFINLSLTVQFIDRQFTDDENTIWVDPYWLANIKLFRNAGEHFTLFIDIDNIMDKEYIDRKGQLSPGRFIIGGIKYHL